jgi:Tfp pilus assembly pilus retraction ATPase PilT
MIQLKFPVRLIIAGSSGIGKSTLLGDMISLRNDLFDRKIDKIIYCTKYESSIPKILRNDKSIFFQSGIPSEEQILNEKNENILFCFDDIADEAFSSGLVGNLFTTGRNRNIGVVLITQNLFPKYSHSREISLNANYYIIFRNIRDGSQINHFAKQVCPNNSKAFREIIENHINREPNGRGYLFCDFSHDVSDLLRFRTNILSQVSTVFFNDESLKEAILEREQLVENSQIQAQIIKIPIFE